MQSNNGPESDPPEEGLPLVPQHDFIPSYLSKVTGIQRSHYYTKDEVARHRTTVDAWLSVQDRVLNVSDLTARSHGITPAERRARATLARYAGTNVTHWFKANRFPLELREFSNWKHNGMQEYFLPQGPIPDVLPFAPVTNYSVPRPGRRKTFWWNEARREIGKLTKKTRKIWVVNMLFASEPHNAAPQQLKVCSEETLKEILYRYLHYNRHAGSYTWKYEGRVLDMDKTLEDNGIDDDEEELKALDINADEYIPVLHVYFNDDLTSA
ncbi:LOW QUALITY PROTEIN: cytochrome b5 domain-containing protein 1-like [Paramacrobiotus metropolitanus]|uniref:LOW QUALITY PROTEIN: cytochrome b5 domain-containing protein 1-like n=1 Tax=Paramacrobiotus metropolitanus TaxID=2943436 RepID=UPI002445CD91|nr:LOW QUALITY PROTEIN: cytochrome b5 domain-containing protein 1-like [Paramacrobiotus metropolitanus]